MWWLNLAAASAGFCGFVSLSRKSDNIFNPVASITRIHVLSTFGRKSKLCVCLFGPLNVTADFIVYYLSLRNFVQSSHTIKTSHQWHSLKHLSCSKDSTVYAQSVVQVALLQVSSLFFFDHLCNVFEMYAWSWFLFVFHPVCLILQLKGLNAKCWFCMCT